MYRYVDTQLLIRIEEVELAVSSKAYVKGIELQNEEGDFVLSTNYFDGKAEREKGGSYEAIKN
ncbi:hypothetical protein LQZ18_07185 [Lachnospiraceae bacterium ZAX-1]